MEEGTLYDHNGQGGDRSRQIPHRRRQAGRIAPVLAVARAVLHEDVVGPRSHQAEALVPLDPGLAKEGTTAEIAPFAVNCWGCRKGGMLC